MAGPGRFRCRRTGMFLGQFLIGRLVAEDFPIAEGFLDLGETALHFLQFL